MPHRPSTMCIWVVLSLARLIILLVACVMSLNLPSFCLLDMVVLLLIKRVTLMPCKLGWFMCKRFFGPLSILDLCLLVCCWSWLPSGSVVLPTCTPFGVALPSWASPLGWFVLFGFLPFSFLSAVLVVFRWAVCSALSICLQFRPTHTGSGLRRRLLSVCH